MKRVVVVVACVGFIGCAKKPLDLTPGPVHDGVSFKPVPNKPGATYLQGEPIAIQFKLKNETDKEIPIMIDYRNPNFGVSYARKLTGGGIEYEALDAPRTRAAEGQPAVKATISNQSFMLLGPGQEGSVFTDNIRNPAPKGGEKGPLPPGTYTYVAEFAFKGNREGTYEEGGKSESMPFEEGDGRVYYDRAARGVWRAECTFTVTSEKAPSRERPAPRGGRPMGG